MEISKRLVWHKYQHSSGFTVNIWSWTLGCNIGSAKTMSTLCLAAGLSVETKPSCSRNMCHHVPTLLLSVCVDSEDKVLFSQRCLCAWTTRFSVFFFFFFFLFFFYSAPHVVLMLRAPEPQKAALESEDQSERLSDFTIPSLSGAHRLSRCFLFLCLSQEDGTVHRASCTRSESVTDRLAAGLLNSPCRVTLGFCFYCSAWSWSGSAGNTRIGKSGGPRRRRRTSRARKYEKNILSFYLGSNVMGTPETIISSEKWGNITWFSNITHLCTALRDRPLPSVFHQESAGGAKNVGDFCRFFPDFILKNTQNVNICMQLARGYKLFQTHFQSETFTLSIWRVFSTGARVNISRLKIHP